MCKNYANLLKTRQRKYLLKKSIKGWQKITLIEKEKELRKIKFYRVLLLKKYLLHIWKKLKNCLQLYKIADKFFMSHKLEKWREYLLKKHSFKKIISKKLDEFSQNIIFKRVFFIILLKKNKENKSNNKIYEVYANFKNS